MTDSVGPWTVREPDGYTEWWVEGPSWVFTESNDVSLENEADARLIAAAPKTHSHLVTSERERKLLVAFIVEKLGSDGLSEAAQRIRDDFAKDSPGPAALP